MDKTWHLRETLTRELLRLSDVMINKAKKMAAITEESGFFSDPYYHPDLLDQPIKDLVALQELYRCVRNRWENPILFRKFGPIS